MNRHYIAFTTPETAEVVSDAAPTPDAGEVLVKVHHAGVKRVS